MKVGRSEARCLRNVNHVERVLFFSPALSLSLSFSFFFSHPLSLSSFFSFHFVLSSFTEGFLPHSVGLISELHRSMGRGP